MSAETQAKEAAVQRIAALARLRIGDHARAELAGQFERILDAFRGLAEVDVEGVEPLSSPFELAEVLREDRVRPSLSPDEALAAAPRREGDFYSVPKTVGGES
jgi:aspartyl-tRNA(Asn)/glutamyl-tRNA(Gln) amidotransferase subunit C